METTMTKAGSDHLKRRARALARATGRRYPDVLAELRRPATAASPAPSRELVRVCGETGFDWDSTSRCTRPFGHQDIDRSEWSSCGTDPHYPAHIWHGYKQAQSDAARAEHDAWWNSLTPEQREEEEAHYWADLAADAAEPVDPNFYKDLDDDDYLGDEDGEW